MDGPMDDHAEAARAEGAVGEPPGGAAAGVDDEVAEVVRGVLALAATLDELPLDGVEPLLGPPRWS